MSEDSGLFNNENFIAPLLVVDGHMVVYTIFVKDKSHDHEIV